MEEQISVFVNGEAVQIHRGMKVKHALIASSPALHRAAEEGEVFVVDQRGFRVGLDGSLQEGAQIFTRPI
ncbi:MAG: hypothetical protein GX443_17755 [Deltaproteobacteria bacterium]|nr:hypothetical protein [Deltaproteobacteria bacterium]